MDPALTQALATLISAAATVLLMAGTYYFKGRKARKAEEASDDESAG